MSWVQLTMKGLNMSKTQQTNSGLRDLIADVESLKQQNHDLMVRLAILESIVDSLGSIEYTKKEIHKPKLVLGPSEL